MGDLNAALRRDIRARRRAITGTERAHKSAQAAAHLLAALPEHARRIAVFLSLREEIDTAPLLHGLWQRGASLYLPYTPARHSALHFLPYAEHTPLVPDALGIPAPPYRREHLISGIALDLIITPLVACDAHGRRIGMGGGFYDRTFAEQRPPLWGLAYACQQVPAITPADWDIPLDALATENGLMFFIKH